MAIKRVSPSCGDCICNMLVKILAQATGGDRDGTVAAFLSMATLAGSTDEAFARFIEGLRASIKNHSLQPDAAWRQIREQLASVDMTTAQKKRQGALGRIRSGARAVGAGSVAARVLKDFLKEKKARADSKGKGGLKRAMIPFLGTNRLARSIMEKAGFPVRSMGDHYQIDLDAAGSD